MKREFPELFQCRGTYPRLGSPDRDELWETDECTVLATHDFAHGYSSRGFIPRLLAEGNCANNGLVLQCSHFPPGQLDSVSGIPISRYAFGAGRSAEASLRARPARRFRVPAKR